MAEDLSLRQQVHQAIDSLPTGHLPILMRLLRHLMPPPRPEAGIAAAPMYLLHRQAAATGIADLAAQHDQYLYGAGTRDV